MQENRGRKKAFFKACSSANGDLEIFVEVTSNLMLPGESTRIGAFVETCRLRAASSDSRKEEAHGSWSSGYTDCSDARCS